MAPITGTTTIARTPDDVFAYIDDLEQRSAWQHDVKSTKRLTDGPMRVGTEVEETRQVSGSKVATMRWRVTGYDPPRRSTFETYEGSMMKPSGVITVTPSGDGSTVTFEMEPNPQGFMKVMMPLLTGKIRKNIAATLGNLKQNLEAG